MNYSEVISAALNYADREDSEVSLRLDTFLRVVESRVNRILQTRNQCKRAYITTDIDKDFYGLPADFAGLRYIQIKDSHNDSLGLTLEFVTPEYMNMAALEGNDLKRYTIINNQLHIYPRLDNLSLEIIYYQRLPALTNIANSNWLSTNYPDAYIFGLLTEISSFVKDIEAASLWDARFKEIMQEMEHEDSIDRWSGPPLSVRLV